MRGSSRIPKTPQALCTGPVIALPGTSVGPLYEIGPPTANYGVDLKVRRVLSGPSPNQRQDALGHGVGLGKAGDTRFLQDLQLRRLRLRSRKVCVFNPAPRGLQVCPGRF